MSIDFDETKQRWRVRWREDGRQKSRRFPSREEAEAFDEARRAESAPSPEPTRARSRGRPSGDGIYAYETKAGTRYRFVFWQSDGSQSTAVATRADGRQLPLDGD